MVIAEPPIAPLRSGYESIFQQAFTHSRQLRLPMPTDIDSAPNKACGDALDPAFNGLYVWSNNVNTLSLANGLADLYMSYADS
jgi:hypothetical protein